ncbi:MAG TPA: MFS transporter [Gemmatimonadaceae bacterium]|nr:MFS transporter [Gemmatimonadaceae bacterium]
MAATKSQTRQTSKWILAASILGSGAVFLEGSVVSVALPSIGRDFGLGMAGLQWVMNGYLLTLSALILLGGALGDRYSRARVFGLGLIGFAISSVACGIAPNLFALVAARIVQGISGADDRRKTKSSGIKE